jgi:tetratricopeptide (TPR) repeat protein
MRYLIFSIAILFSLNMPLLSQETEKGIQKGNELYKEKKYSEAESAYDGVIAKDPSSTTAKINKANAQYRGNKTTEAIKTLDELSANNEEKEIKARAFYNKGAILSSQKKLEESVDAYKEALRKDPSDKQARENLQKALLELKKKNPPPKKEDKKQQKQNKQQQQPKMNQKEAEQRLKLLEQKEKEVQQRLQKEKSKQGGGQAKDW